MKKYILILFLIFLNKFSYSQDKEKDSVILFLDECSNDLKKGEYSFISSNVISYSYTRGDLVTKGTILGFKPNDNIKINKIALFADSNDKLIGYYNCNLLCNGIEKDFYENGKTRLYGEFKNGKPIEIKVYSYNGIIISKDVYFSDSFTPKRTDFFDFDGKLEGYYIYEKKGTKMIIKQYDNKENLIKTDLENISEYE